jgi:hypothetical protein
MMFLWFLVWHGGQFLVVSGLLITCAACAPPRPPGSGGGTGTVHALGRTHGRLQVRQRPDVVALLAGMARFGAAGAARDGGWPAPWSLPARLEGDFEVAPWSLAAPRRPGASGARRARPCNRGRGYGLPAHRPTGRFDEAGPSWWAWAVGRAPGPGRAGQGNGRLGLRPPGPAQGPGRGRNCGSKSNLGRHRFQRAHWPLNARMPPPVPPPPCSPMEDAMRTSHHRPGAASLLWPPGPGEQPLSFPWSRTGGNSIDWRVPSSDGNPGRWAFR